MKFWKSKKASSTALSIKKTTLAAQKETTPIQNYENFDDDIGTTFVELIKRPGTFLGIFVAEESNRPASTISKLVQGSWAQRSNVLCVGDTIQTINRISVEGKNPREISNMLNTPDRVQLEVVYPLPPLPLSKHKLRTIEIMLHKACGSFGMVIRGGRNDNPQKSRPFSVVSIDANGPACVDGTVRVGDRILAINSTRISSLRLPEFQTLLYQEDGPTEFLVEYTVDRRRCNAGYVEISSQGKIGLKLSNDRDSNHVYIEHIEKASNADRCGALNVGDVLLSINGTSLDSYYQTDEVISMIKSTHNKHGVTKLKISPTKSARMSSSEEESSLSTSSSRLAFDSHQRRKTSILIFRHNSLNNMDKIKNNFHRHKFVTFTVQLERQPEDECFGFTLLAENNDDDEQTKPSKIIIGSLTLNGLAQREGSICVNDQLVELNGVCLKDKGLDQVISLLQASSSTIKLKLARSIRIPERERSLHSHTNKRLSQEDNRFGRIPIVEQKCSKAISDSGSTTEIRKITLYKDKIFDDFGFSVSDGLHEPGVYVNRIRDGGPAHIDQQLQSFDRILQINSTTTVDCDCCLAVPLIASSDHKVDIYVSRYKQNK